MTSASLPVNIRSLLRMYVYYVALTNW